MVAHVVILLVGGLIVLTYLGHIPCVPLERAFLACPLASDDHLGVFGDGVADDGRKLGLVAVIEDDTGHIRLKDTHVVAHQVVHAATECRHGPFLVARQQVLVKLVERHLQFVEVSSERDTLFVIDPGGAHLACYLHIAQNAHLDGVAVEADMIDALGLSPVLVYVYHRGVFVIVRVLIRKWSTAEEHQLLGLLKPGLVERLRQQRVEVRAEAIAVGAEILAVGGDERHVVQFPAPIRQQGVGDVVVFLGLDDDILTAQVGVDPAVVQDAVGVVVLFGHAHDAPHRLRAKLRALDVAEDEQHGSSRTVPSEGYGLLEEQRLREVVVALQAFQVLLVGREPDSQLAVVHGDVILHREPCLHPFHNGALALVECL